MPRTPEGKIMIHLRASLLVVSYLTRDFQPKENSVIWTAFSSHMLSALDLLKMSRTSQTTQSIEENVERKMHIDGMKNFGFLSGN